MSNDYKSSRSSGKHSGKTRRKTGVLWHEAGHSYTTRTGGRTRKQQSERRSWTRGAGYN